MGTTGETARRLAVSAARRTAWAAVLVVTCATAANAMPAEVATTQTAKVSLSGSVRGLRPGAVAALHVTVRNDSAGTAHVTGVTTAVSAPGTCARHLSVAPFAGVLDVPPNGVRTVVLRAALDSATPASCAATGWRLDYTAR
jgi:hypothetical protein